MRSEQCHKGRLMRYWDAAGMQGWLRIGCLRATAKPEFLLLSPGSADKESKYLNIKKKPKTCSYLSPVWNAPESSLSLGNIGPPPSSFGLDIDMHGRISLQLGFSPVGDTLWLLGGIIPSDWGVRFTLWADISYMSPPPRELINHLEGRNLTYLGLKIDV